MEFYFVIKGIKEALTTLKILHTGRSKARTYQFESITCTSMLLLPPSRGGNLFTKLNPLSNRPIYCSGATTHCVVVMPLDEWTPRDPTSRAVPTAHLRWVLPLFDVCEYLPCEDPLLFPKRECYPVCPGSEN